MENFTIFSTLLNFPLFHGLGKIDLEGIVSQTRFDFNKFSAGKVIATADTACDRVFFLLNGTVEASREAVDHGYVITEELSSPYIFQIECIFGYQRYHTHTFKALTPANVMSIDREELLKLMENYPEVRFNILNQLAELLLKERSIPWKHQSDDLTERFIAFISNHLLHKAGKKCVKIKMLRLAHEINTGRTEISKILNNLNESHLIILGRGGFEIPKMEFLLNYKSVIV